MNPLFQITSSALESLMGFILAIVSVEMLISGVRIVLNLK